MHIFCDTSMHAHNLFVNKSDQRHVIETIIKLLPETDFVSSFYLVKESVNTRDSLSFVVATESNNLGWISYFQGEEETDNFCTLSSSIDVVTHE